MDTIAYIKQGDVTVFTEIFHALHNKVFSFYMKRTHRNRELARELTQLAFIKLWNSRSSLSEQHPIEKQLFVISRSVLIDHFRSLASRKNAQDIFAPADMPDTAWIQHTSMAAFESGNFMETLMGQLPPARKKVIQLKFIHGFSNREIAERLSVSVKTVEDHVTKGLKELRTHPELYIAVTLSCLGQVSLC